MFPLSPKTKYFVKLGWLLLVATETASLVLAPLGMTIAHVRFPFVVVNALVDVL